MQTSKIFHEVLKLTEKRDLEVEFVSRIRSKTPLVGTTYVDGGILLLKRHRDRLVSIFLHELLHLRDWDATEREILELETRMMRDLTSLNKNQLLVALANVIEV